MALIKCLECGKEISDKAVACPSCGCPSSEWISSNTTSMKQSSTPPECMSPEELTPIVEKIYNSHWPGEIGKMVDDLVSKKRKISGKLWKKGISWNISLWFIWREDRNLLSEMPQWELFVLPRAKNNSWENKDKIFCKP